MFDSPSPERNKNEIYDEAATKWWSDEKRWVRTLKNMAPGRLSYFDTIVHWEGKSVLDIGCAGGFMAEEMEKRRACVSGIDPSEPAIDAARTHARAEGFQIDYAVGVGEDLPYADGMFDIVVSVDMLEHVSDLSQVISEISRVLKPGGKFLFDTINRTPIAAFLTVTMAEDVLRVLPKGAHDPALFIKPCELVALLKENGFVPGALTGLGPRGVDRRGDLTFGRLPTTSVIYMGSAILRKGSDNVGSEQS